MYQVFIFLHSFFRWFVVLSLCYALVRSFSGYITGRKFSKADNTVRHWTATIAHVQLILGIMVYMKSPVIRYCFSHFKEAIKEWDTVFFALVHAVVMLAAIVILTIGSALARRRSADNEKFRTMLFWFATAFILIFIAIPWPFSPLAHRPYFR